VQGVTITAWQYKDSTGAWKDYPTTSDNASISGGTLVVKPEHAVFFNGVAQIKLATDDPDVYDTTSLTKIYDGSQGEPGAALPCFCSWEWSPPMTDRRCLIIW